MLGFGMKCGSSKECGVHEGMNVTCLQPMCNWNIEHLHMTFSGGDGAPMDLPGVL